MIKPILKTLRKVKEWHGRPAREPTRKMRVLQAKSLTALPATKYDVCGQTGTSAQPHLNFGFCPFTSPVIQFRSHYKD